MAALSEGRSTSSRAGSFLRLPIATGVTCYTGGLAVLMPDGKVRPAIVDASAPSCVAVGRFHNNATAITNVSVDVEPGIYRWDNHATDTVGVSHLQGICYATDDHTVAATSANATRSPAGKVLEVDDYGVWVDTTLSSCIKATANQIRNVALGSVAVAGSGVVRFVAAAPGTLVSVRTVVSAAFTVGDAVLTVAINGTGVTDGVVTIATSGSAANVTDLATPTALNTFVAGDVITVTVSGSASGAGVVAFITLGVI